MNAPSILALACLVVPAQDPRIDAPSVLARVPFESEVGLILVELRVGDSEPMPFVLDTGANNVVIDRSLAEHLELAKGPDRSRARSATRGELTYSFVPELTFHFGDYAVDLSQVLVAPAEGTARAVMGRSIYGIIGHEFFVEHTVEVDYRRGELVLHDPESYRYSGDGAILPLRFDVHGPLPFVSVGLESATGEVVELPMLVDSAGSVLVTCGVGTQAGQNAVLSDASPRVPSVAVTGLANTAEGTMRSSFMTRLAGFRIGPYSLERPVVSCGSLGFHLFGAEVLRRFHVVFDYPRKRLILEPTAALDEPTPADRAGMILVASEEDADLRQVLFVTPGGPAEASGLARGDVLLEVDGRPAAGRSLNATRALFHELGTFELTLRRGTRVFDATLRTRDLL